MFEFRVAPHGVEEWCLERRVRVPFPEELPNMGWAKVRTVKYEGWLFPRSYPADLIFETREEAVKEMRKQQCYWDELQDNHKRAKQRREDKSLYEY